MSERKIMSAGEAKQQYNEAFDDKKCRPYFIDWWYWQECNYRDDGSLIINGDDDYESFENWFKRRRIPQALSREATYGTR